MKNIFIIVFISFAACRNEPSEKTLPQLKVVSAESDSISGESDDRNRINDSVYRITKENYESIFNLYYSKNPKQNISFDSLTIINKSSEKITQKIGFKKDYFLRSAYQITFSVDNDVNFDCLNDIQLSNYVGSYNSTYRFWIYDSKSHRYKHNAMLDNINNPEILPEIKEIQASWRIAFESFHEEKYRWEKGNLILFEERVEYNPSTSGNRYETYKVLRNGKYYITEKHDSNRD